MVQTKPITILVSKTNVKDNEHHEESTPNWCRHMVLNVDLSTYAESVLELGEGSLIINGCSDQVGAAVAQLLETRMFTMAGSESDAYALCHRRSTLREFLRENVIFPTFVKISSSDCIMTKMEGLKPPYRILPDLIAVPPEEFESALAATVDIAKEQIQCALKQGVDVIVEEAQNGQEYVILVGPEGFALPLQLAGWTGNISSLFRTSSDEICGHVLKQPVKPKLNSACFAAATKAFARLTKVGYGLVFIENVNAASCMVRDIVIGGDFIFSNIYNTILNAHEESADLLLSALLQTSREGKIEPKLKIVAMPGSKGEYLVVGSRNLRADEIVSFLDLMPTMAVNSRYAVTRGFGVFYDTTGYPESRLNHSCNPNLYICFEDHTFRARQDIKEGEELTFNYLFNEYEMATPFECMCGAENCFKYIAGFRNLTASEQTALVKHGSPWVKYNYYAK